MFSDEKQFMLLMLNIIKLKTGENYIRCPDTNNWGPINVPFKSLPQYDSAVMVRGISGGPQLCSQNAERNL